MGFERLLANYGKLVGRMAEDGYSEGYVRDVLVEVEWIRRNGHLYDSSESACLAREAETQSPSVRTLRRGMFGILKAFDVDGAYPVRWEARPLFARGAYHRLSPGYRGLVDAFLDGERVRGLSDSGIRRDASGLSTFLLSMQERGRASLDEVTEDDVLDFFTDEDGGPKYAANHSEVVSRALRSVDDASGASARVASYVPRAKRRRKNVQYLRPEEVDAVRDALSDGGNGLTPRDRAMGSLLLHTGLRAGDVAGLALGDIDWELDEINVTQSKTGEPLTLPLTAAVGNALYDYIVGERPAVDDPHVFLSRREPHVPVTYDAVHSAAERIYAAAGVRQREGDRRGTHLFRHNAATTMVSTGTPRVVASAVLGHVDPKSIDSYLSADIEHLRTCALDVSRFPVGKGVFDV